MRKPLPIGAYTFRDIVEGGCKMDPCINDVLAVRNPETARHRLRRHAPTFCLRQLLCLRPSWRRRLQAAPHRVRQKETG